MIVSMSNAGVGSLGYLDLSHTIRKFTLSVDILRRQKSLPTVVFLIVHVPGGGGVVILFLSIAVHTLFRGLLSLG